MTNRLYFFISESILVLILFQRFVARKRSQGRGRPLLILVIFKGSYEGHHQATLTFTFFDSSTNETFYILRDLIAIVGYTEHYQRLGAVAPYTGRSGFGDDDVPRSRPRRIFRAKRPEGWMQVDYVIPLPRYDMLKELCTALDANVDAGEIRRKFLPKSLNPITYSKYFQVLLWIEEFAKQ